MAAKSQLYRLAKALISSCQLAAKHGEENNSQPLAASRNWRSREMPAKSYLHHPAALAKAYSTAA
jgi:hypothetical protein